MTKSYSSKAELRRKAEARFSKKKDKTQPLTKADTWRVVHELQVHQIELEMQNEDATGVYSSPPFGGDVK